MRFTLIQVDTMTLDFAKVIKDSRKHRILTAFRAGAHAPALTSMGIKCLDLPWEELLVDADTDAIFFGWAGNPEERREQLRLIAQTGIPLLLMYPQNDLLIGFELQMIQQETQGLIAPFFPGLCQPSALLARKMLRQPGSADRVISAELRWTWRSPSNDQAEAQFGRDVLQLRQLFGRLVRVHAVSPRNTTSVPWSSLLVHLVDDRDRIIQWSGSTGPEDHGSLILMGNQGREVLDWSGPESLALQEIDNYLDEFEASVNDRQRKSQFDQLWEDACRADEIRDAVQRSLSKGRAIELYDEVVSERSTFNGVMAAGGCLLLLGLLICIPLLMLLENFFPWLSTSIVWRRGPWLVVAVLLLVFLGVQMLRPLTADRRPIKE